MSRAKKWSTRLLPGILVILAILALCFGALSTLAPSMRVAAQGQPLTPAPTANPAEQPPGSSSSGPSASAPMSFAPVADTTVAPVTGPAAVNVTITDTAFTGLPDTLPPGLTPFSFLNGTQQPQGAQIVRPNPGVTMDQLAAANEKASSGSNADFAALLALVTVYGGADTLAPGQSENVTVNLDPGSYLLAQSSGNNQPVPFQVTGTPNGVPQPQAGYTLTQREFAFALPSHLPPGVNTIKISNIGTQDHEMDLLYIGNHTLADVEAAINEPNPPDWAIPAGGLNAQGPGMTSWLTVNLQSGNYAVVCFMPDPATDLPHAALGMLSVVTVQ